MATTITTTSKQNRMHYPPSIRPALIGGKRGRELFVTVGTKNCDWGCKYCGLGKLDGKFPPLSVFEAKDQMDVFFSQLPESERSQILKVSLISMSNSLLLPKTVEPAALIEMAKSIPKFLPNVLEASIESRGDVKDDAALGTAKSFFEELFRGLKLPSLAQEIVIGIETASDEIRRATGKLTTNNQIAELAGKLAQLEIGLRGYFIYNLLERDDNLGALMRSIDFMAGLREKTNINPSILILRGYVPEGLENTQLFAGFTGVSDEVALRDLRAAATYAKGKVKFEIDSTSEDQQATNSGLLSPAYTSALVRYNLTFNPEELHI